MTGRHALNVVRVLFLQSMSHEDGLRFDAQLEGVDVDAAEDLERHEERVERLRAMGGLVIEA